MFTVLILISRVFSRDNVFSDILTTSIHQVVESRLGSVDPSASSFLQMKHSPEITGFISEKTLYDSTCVDLNKELQLLYADSQSDLEVLLYEDCLQNIVNLKWREDELTIKKSELLVDIADIDKNITRLNASIDEALAQISLDEGELGRITKECNLELPILEKSYRDAETTLKGFADVANNYTNIVLPEHLKKDFGFLSITRPFLSLISRHEVKRQGMNHLCQILLKNAHLYDINSGLTNCAKNVTLDNRELTVLFGRMFNETDHIHNITRNKYFTKKNYCDNEKSRLDEQITNTQQIHDDSVIERDGLLESLNDKNSELKTTQDELNNIPIRIREKVDFCNEEIKGIIDSSLCPIKYLRNTLFEKCANDLPIKYIDCQMDMGLNQPKTCVCENNQYLIDRKIIRNNNEYGFGPGKLQYRVSCGGEQEICDIIAEHFENRGIIYPGNVFKLRGLIENGIFHYHYGSEIIMLQTRGDFFVGTEFNRENVLTHSFTSDCLGNHKRTSLKYPICIYISDQKITKDDLLGTPEDNAGFSALKPFVFLVNTAGTDTDLNSNEKVFDETMRELGLTETHIYMSRKEPVGPITETNYDLKKGIHGQIVLSRLVPILVKFTDDQNYVPEPYADKSIVKYGMAGIGTSSFTRFSNDDIQYFDTANSRTLCYFVLSQPGPTKIPVLILKFAVAHDPFFPESALKCVKLYRDMGLPVASINADVSNGEIEQVAKSYISHPDLYIESADEVYAIRTLTSITRNLYKDS